MFDSMNLQITLSDMFDLGINDDTLALLYEANQNIDMIVKTPVGLTESLRLQVCSTSRGKLGASLCRRICGQF